MLRKLNFFTFALLVLSTTTMLGCRSDNSDSRLPLDELSAGTEQDGSAGGEGSGDSDESNSSNPYLPLQPTEDDWDGDGVPNEDDPCPRVPGVDPALCNESVDPDGDGFPTLYPTIEPFISQDIVGQPWDNCPDIANPSQSDLDGNGVGDTCDKDIDGDGVLNDADNCPVVANPGQNDENGNGIGDACDPGIEDGFSCSVEGIYSPMRANDSAVKATTSVNTTGCLLSGDAGSLLCGVNNPNNVVDDDLTNTAAIYNTNLLGLSSVSLRIASGTNFVYPANNYVGVAIRNAPQLVKLGLLTNGGLQVRTLLNGEVQEETGGSVGADLDLLGLSQLIGSGDFEYLVFETSQPFDAVEIFSGGFELLSVLEEFEVSRVCAAKTGIPDL
ncbi:hypothetical protein B9Q17_16845 [Marinobacter vinifirmus]|uniref:Thrombospondin n=1 Tax=Marinobacter vinifirmus TaxID=355591 RepID=A0A7Z1IMP3_9GAMM|nr:hypothetical protein B9Q17_16845 [Marinobacter vinifirmus]